MAHPSSLIEASRPAHAVARAGAPSAVLGTAFVVLWSTGYPAARIALDHAAPFTLLMLRFAGAGLLFALLAALGGAEWPRGRAMVHSATVGMLTLGLQFSALYWAAAQGVNVGLIALVVGTMPIVTALLGLAFLGEAVRPVQWLGFAIGFSGVALVVGEGVGAGAGAGGSAGAGLSAYLAVFVGLLAISIGTLYQKRHASNLDPRSGLAVQHLAAALPLLPFALHEGFRFDASGAFFASLAWVIGINSLSAFALFFVLLRRGAVNQVATLFFLMPPATALIDYFVLGDSLTLSKLAGVIVAAAGVFIATRPSAAAPQPASLRRPVSAPCAAVRHSYQAPCG
jgi:drug/metabolite transporter (DMT)-like permease